MSAHTLYIITNQLLNDYGQFGIPRVNFETVKYYLIDYDMPTNTLPRYNWNGDTDINKTIKIF